MSDETLLACFGTDDEQVTDAVAARLCIIRHPGHEPSSAALRASHRRRARKQAGIVTPKALEYLRTVDPDPEHPAVEAACEEYVKAALSPLTVWLLGQLVAVIVRLLVRWYFSERSVAYRQRAQAQGRQHVQ